MPTHPARNETGSNFVHKILDHFIAGTGGGFSSIQHSLTKEQQQVGPQVGQVRLGLTCQERGTETTQQECTRTHVLAVSTPSIAAHRGLYIPWCSLAC